MLYDVQIKTSGPSELQPHWRHLMETELAALLLSSSESVHALRPGTPSAPTKAENQTAAPVIPYVCHHKQDKAFNP